MKYAYAGNDEEKILMARSDAKAARMKQMLRLRDLTRKPGTPVYLVMQAIINAPSLKGHDVVTFPEIVPVEMNFDLLGTPADHPSRRPSDTFYVDERHVLRTQTTTMWPYYLRDPAVLKRLGRSGALTAISYGKVFRNDKIDRRHYPVFHQVDALGISATAKRTYGLDDLVAILGDIAKSVFGPAVEWRVEKTTFPFTNPSLELQVLWNNEWTELLGAGLVHPKVLALLGLNPQQYNGWAFGFGLDRVAMVKMNIPDIRILWSNDDRITRQFTGIDSTYHPVSVYPPTDRDVSMLVDRSVDVKSIYELIRECGNHQGEDLIEEVRLQDRYENAAAFGEGKVSYTFRIRYRSHERTLMNAEINQVQERLRLRVADEFGALLR